ncbi:MAG: AgmX/PglI C-terminal domain-containing protein [Myxococcota bacterium]|nr:AgmX/PglI C-terminal domain-containing protein [Myxococcota bacterium]MDW8362428.1 AgmX/PglI C-terminal domain-containing protein [Myxococcales bacterium]
MPPESTSNQQQSGGSNAKYAVIGLLLLAAAAGIWIALPGQPTTPPAPPPTTADAGVRPPPPPDDLIIVESEPDAGVEDAGPPGTCRTSADCAPGARCIDGRCTRFVTRYVAGDWECSGNIPQAQAAAVVNEYRRQVRNCYERRLKVNHRLQGNLTLRMKVNSSGNVEATSVGGSLGDPEVFACIRQLASTWRFPAPQGGNCAVVSAPFNFTPQQ